MIIQASQLRAARALVGLSQKDIAERSGVSVPTVKRMEGSDGAVRGGHAAVAAVVAVLESAGVTFTNGGEPGVKLRKQP